DMYHGAEYYWQGKSKGFSFFTTVPMGLNSVELEAWIRFGGGQELWEELSGGFGVKPILCANTGVQSGGWFRSELASLEDFKGLTIRMPGLGGEVVRRLGAAPVSLPGGEIYPAIQSGAVDAAEWVGPWNDLAFGFFQEASYYYNPGFHEPGAALAIGVNRGVWDGLSAEHQAILQHACTAVNDISKSEFAYYSSEALQVLVRDHGVQLRSFSDEMWTEIARISEEVMADVGAEDALTGRIYDSYIAARKLLSGWTRVSESGYLRQRERLIPSG
ncbi:MAG: TRAP transporter substrate-binding protein, partial [Caulobacterales bacterium]|nr:TRAP transporter substrate-binding protein [Caulobacterales bacterium]